MNSMKPVEKDMRQEEKEVKYEYKKKSSDKSYNDKTASIIRKK